MANVFVRLVHFFTSNYDHASGLIRRKARSLVVLHIVMVLFIAIYVVTFTILGAYAEDVKILSVIVVLLWTNLLILRSGRYALAVSILLAVCFIGLSSLVYIGDVKSHLKLYSLGMFHLVCLVVAGFIGDRAWQPIVVGSASAGVLSHYLFAQVMPTAAESFVSMLDAYIAALIVLAIATSISTIINHQLARAFGELTDLATTLEERVKERTAELERSREKLVETEKLAALGDMVGGLSHEVNTPLGNSITAHSFFREQLEDVERAVEAGQLSQDRLRVFVSRAKEVGDLVSRNLDVAANLMGNFKMIATDLHAEDPRRLCVLSDLHAMLMPLDKKLRREGRISIEIDGPEDMCVMGRPGVLWQIATNLVNNAVVHGYPEGSGIIVVAYGSSGEDFILEVRDQGRGMSEQTRKKVYDPFFTTRRGSGGTGLGLNIVYNLIHEAGGVIDCESAPGRGTTFRVQMPWPKSNEGASTN